MRDGESAMSVGVPEPLLTRVYRLEAMLGEPWISARSPNAPAVSCRL
jgi:hypothetical protein